MPKMNILFVSIRNCFLDKSTSPLSRRILLEMIEGIKYTQKFVI